MNILTCSYIYKFARPTAQRPNGPTACQTLGMTSFFIDKSISSISCRRPGTLNPQSVHASDSPRVVWRPLVTFRSMFEDFRSNFVPTQELVLFPIAPKSAWIHFLIILDGFLVYFGGSLFDPFSESRTLDCYQTYGFCMFFSPGGGAGGRGDGTRKAFFSTITTTATIIPASTPTMSCERWWGKGSAQHVELVSALDTQCCVSIHRKVRLGLTAGSD